MSEGNVEVVRQVFEAIASRDSKAALALYDPGIEWDATQDPTMRAMFGSGVYRGQDDLRRFFREWYEAWDDIRNEPEELIDAGDSVVVVVTDRARGRASGAEVVRTHAAVWTIRAGKVTRVVWFPTREQALEAAGLSE
jgi:ketosteroid isomerase-like protein